MAKVSDVGVLAALRAADGVIAAGMEHGEPASRVAWMRAAINAANDVDATAVEREPGAEALRAEQPLTAAQLADAFDVMWNAALGVSNARQEGAAVASMLAEGFSQMAAALRASSLDYRKGLGS